MIIELQGSSASSPLPKITTRASSGDCDISNPWVLEQAMGVDVGLEWRFSTPDTPFSFRGVFYDVSQHPENRLPFLFAVTPILILHISRSTLRRIVFAG